MSHPKYVLQFDSYAYYRYQIMEYCIAGGEVSGKMRTSFQDKEGALRVMGELCGKPVILAVSECPVDNTFEV